MSQARHTMPVNMNKPHLWKDDIARSVDMYNEWFLTFAPKTYRDTRIEATHDVQNTLKATNNLLNLSPELLKTNPSVLATLRMSTCPPIAVDRLVGLAGIKKSLVKKMEQENKTPPRMTDETLQDQLEKILQIINRLIDPDIFVWLEEKKKPTQQEIYRAATVVADRLCGSIANPLIRNEQEHRQLAKIADWLNAKGYQPLPDDRSEITFDTMPPGTYSFRFNVPVAHDDEGKHTNIPIDTVIMPLSAKKGELPLLIEAKSAGDFTNVNKRRKEEAQKMTQLKATYGKNNVQFILFLCGYFDGGYLGYEATEGIDWVWEHRIDDLAEFGL